MRKGLLFALLSFGAMVGGCSAPASDPASEGSLVRVDGEKDDGPVTALDGSRDYAIEIRELSVLDTQLPASDHRLFLDLNSARTTPCAESPSCYDTPTTRDTLDRRFSGSELNNGVDVSLFSVAFKDGHQNGIAQRLRGLGSFKIGSTGTFKIEKFDVIGDINVRFSVKFTF